MVILYSGRRFSVELQPIGLPLLLPGVTQCFRRTKSRLCESRPLSGSVVGDTDPPSRLVKQFIRQSDGRWQWLGTFFAKSLGWREEVHSAFLPSFACREGSAHARRPYHSLGPLRLTRSSDWISWLVGRRWKKRCPHCKRAKYSEAWAGS